MYSLVLGPAGQEDDIVYSLVLELAEHDDDICLIDGAGCNFCISAAILGDLRVSQGDNGLVS